MKKTLRQKLKRVCVATAYVAVGAILGARFLRPPAPPRPASNPADAAEAVLDRVIPAIDLDETPFDEAVAKVERLSGVRLIVQWGAMERAGWSPRMPVRFRARDATLERALEALVAPYRAPSGNGPFGSELVYVPTPQGILLTTPSAAETVAGPYAREYDVHDLVRPADPPAGSGATGGCIVLPPSKSEDADGPERLPPADDLIRFIHDAVAPDAWRVNGGIGSIQSFSGRLVVVQTWSVHRQVRKLLEQMRDTPVPPKPPPPSPDLRLWDEQLQTYVPKNPEAAEAALRQKLPEVRLENLPLERAVVALRELSHANLVADWGRLESAGAMRDKPVSLHLRDVTLEDAARALLDSAGASPGPVPGGGSPLAVCPDGGYVLLTTRDDDRVMCARFYDVRDYLTAATTPPGTPAPTKPVYGPSRRASMDDAADRLITGVRASIAPDSWRDDSRHPTGAPANGGGWVYEHAGGWLVVTQTWENQQKVADLLAALRSPRSGPTSRPAPVR